MGIEETKKPRFGSGNAAKQRGVIIRAVICRLHIELSFNSAQATVGLPPRLADLTFVRSFLMLSL